MGRYLCSLRKRWLAVLAHPSLQWVGEEERAKEALAETKNRKGVFSRAEACPSGGKVGLGAGQERCLGRAAGTGGRKPVLWLDPFTVWNRGRGSLRAGVPKPQAADRYQSVAC